jgi:hypothetical protein
VTDEVRQTTYPDAEPCPVCGEYHPECDANLLGAMYLGSWIAAREVLSEAGVATLRMIVSAAEHIGVSDAYMKARVTSDLDREELDAIENFLARLILIEHFEKERGVHVTRTLEEELEREDDD